jgi:hypothetical protein
MKLIVALIRPESLEARVLDAALERGRRLRLLLDGAGT